MASKAGRRAAGRVCEHCGSTSGDRVAVKLRDGPVVTVCASRCMRLLARAFDDHEGGDYRWMIGALMRTGQR